MTNFLAVLLLGGICVTLGVKVYEDRQFQNFNKDYQPEVILGEDPDLQGQELWAYVNIREGAHMFWWLYYTTHEDGYQNRPTIIWLQGGPGASSTGYGNFEIIGPLDLDLNPRNTTWLQSANILFIDNPVGAGYSYVEDPMYFTQNVSEIADDLLTVWNSFTFILPEFKRIPLYIFGQSYGGKMGAVFAQRLNKAIIDGDAEADLAGFAMGNSWISPIDSTTTWGPFLYWMSTTDEPGYIAIQNMAMRCKEAVDNENWELATTLWAATEMVVWEYTNYVDFYNVLRFYIPEQAALTKWNQWLKAGNKFRHDALNRILVEPDLYDQLDDLMNGPIREKLGIIPENVIWGAQYDPVFDHQEGDFMKPVVDVIDDNLMNTDMDVIVYQGQLDLICDTKASMDWVQQLTWPGIANYTWAERKPLTVPENGQTDTFVKAFQNFKFYNNLRAGHAVPKEDGWGALRMLERILNDTDH